MSLESKNIAVVKNNERGKKWFRKRNGRICSFHDKFMTHRYLNLIVFYNKKSLCKRERKTFHGKNMAHKTETIVFINIVNTPFKNGNCKVE